MSDLRNPMRFSIRHKTVDIDGWLGGSKKVTQIDIRPGEGQIYVHWEETDNVTTFADLKDVSSEEDTLEIALAKCKVKNEES